MFRFGDSETQDQDDHADDMDVDDGRDQYTIGRFRYIAPRAER
jgi:hypothetical protein